MGRFPWLREDFNDTGHLITPPTWTISRHAAELRSWTIGCLCWLLLAVSVALNVALLCSGAKVTNIACDCSRMDVSGYLCAPNGARPEEARRRGCEFDPISFHWYPRRRVLDADNQAIIRQFLDKGPWHRYYDAEGTVEVDPKNEALTALWLTKREHVVHCMYTLQQTHLWLNKGFDPPFNYSHTLHCTSWLVSVIMESPPTDLDALTVHAVPYPHEWQVVKPKFPCEEEGLSCVSW
ncbi:hypothetical protein CCHL11_03206 [Colletotrichum chlorophyti]|uniref:Uncharacterized protein n=1 Tax=Colletotrichum chlorophyti TaxID=708187 RepID=A0A1Q8S3U9_9PEZI|nr:hypothetical protein CCHL11_03206 [Colletotrichum chlorophyti]